MRNKIENLQDLKYYSNMLLCTGLIKKWTDLKPDNPDLQKMAKALIDITLYVIRLQEDLQCNKIAVSDYRYRKNKALLELKELKDNQTYEI